MISIQEIKIGSYKLLTNTSLELNNLAGLISIVGNNIDIENFSSNSVGKSTLPNAILQGLFGKNIGGASIESCTNLYTNTKPSIEITFIKEGVEYLIQRDYQIGKLRWFKDGHISQFTKKTDIQADIERTVGLNFFLASNLIYISTATNSLFSSANNQNQASFIQSLLGLEFIQDIHKKATAELKSFQGDLKLKIKEVSLAKTNMENLTKQLELIPKIEIIDYTDELLSITTECATIKGLGKSLSEVCNAAKGNLKAREQELIETNNDLKHLKKKHKEELDLIELGSCPTCSQPTASLGTTTNISTIKKLERYIAQITKEMDEIKLEVKGYDKTMVEYTSKITKLNNRKSIIDDHILRQAKESSSEDIRTTIMEQLSKALTESTTLQEELNELETRVYLLSLIQESSSAKGFIKQRVQLFLKLFNIELGNLCKDLLGGEFKVNIARTTSGHYELRVIDEIELNYSSLSSGFRARLDIVLALALNKTVETLTGISLNVLFLDEIISSVDEVGVDTIAGLLTKVERMFPSKVIFLVSHNQDMVGVTKKLVVTRKEGESKLNIL